MPHLRRSSYLEILEQLGKQTVTLCQPRTVLVMEQLIEIWKYPNFSPFFFFLKHKLVC